jgi:tetratricopeptide (TPR) repeat protein
MAQNLLLICLDTDIDQLNEDCQNALTQVRSIVDDVNICTQPDECINFLTKANDMKAFLIVEGTLGQQIVPLIHDLPQLNAIYIFSSNNFRHEQWTQEWVKIKDIHAEMTPICQSIQKAMIQCNQDAIAVSFITADEATFSQDLNQLEPSFMYTQIFKEILLKLEYGSQSIKDFTTYCRNNAYGSLTNITRFENDYHAKSAIWWYTFPSFIYSMLNCALRMLEADTIIKMGFFIHDLHHQIEQMYQTQIGDYHGQPFIVYRGQGLSETDFEKLLKTKGGLMSFNNFLSTSRNEEISLDFANGALTNTGTVGILFKISIDPSISSAPFAPIREVSYYEEEEEILFSMHTVFRVGEMTKIDNNNSLYQVELKLTVDNDQQLRDLTDRISKEATGPTDWSRFGNVLVRIGQFDKAEELYNALLEQTSDENEKVFYYDRLGHVKDNQGDYETAVSFYEKALEISQKTCPSNYFLLATINKNIGWMYTKMGEHSKAFSFHVEALDIFQNTVSPDHSNIIIFYDNIAATYYKAREFSIALSFYLKLLGIFQKNPPPNHFYIIQCYDSIGAVYNKMGDYSKAVSFYEKALDVVEKTLPPNYPDIAQCYDNVGAMYNKMGEYSKSLSFYVKALDIFQKILSPDHPYITQCYDSIGAMYNKMGDYSKALSFYEKVLYIIEKTHPSNYSDIIQCYDNISLMYRNMGEYSKALTFEQKLIEMKNKILPPDHPSFADPYNEIGLVYDKTEEYQKSLPFLGKDIDIQQKTLPPNHLLLATSYNDISLVYKNLKQYSVALSFYEKALEIRQESLPLYHPEIAQSYNNIASVYDDMGEYSKALSYYERAREIWERSLPRNHPLLRNVRRSIEIVKKKL